MKQSLSHKIGNFLFLVVVLICLSFINTLAQSSDLSITSTPLKLAKPGDLVTHVFTVKNETTDAATYDLTLNLPKGWTSLPIPNRISLGGGGSKPVFANVNVPEKAASEKYTITLKAEEVSGMATASKQTHIQVQSVPDFLLTWISQPAELRPGTTAEGRIEIGNTGNVTDRYSVEVTVPEEWNYSMKKEEIQLLPGQSKSAIVGFTVPDGAESGRRYEISIEVLSIKNPDLQKELVSTGRLAPPPPEKISKVLFPKWDTSLNISADQKGAPKFTVNGSGDLRTIGTVNANFGAGMEGFESGSLSLQKERWGFHLSEGSISGSHFGVKGMPFFTGEFENSSAEVIYTEDEKGLSLERQGKNWEIRSVFGIDSVDGISGAELQGIYEFPGGIVFDGVVSTGRTRTESGSIVEMGLELPGGKVELFPSFQKIYPGYPRQAPREGVSLDVRWQEQDFTSFFYWDYDRQRLEETAEDTYSQEHDFVTTTSMDLGEELDSNFSLGLNIKKSNDQPASNDSSTWTLSGSLSGGDTLGWNLGANLKHSRDRVSNTETTQQRINAGINFEIGESEHSVNASFSGTEAPESDTYSNNFSISSSFPEQPLSPNFSLTRGEEDTTFRMNLSETNAEELTLNLTLSMSLIQQDNLSTSISISWPGIFPFAGPTKGQVSGVLFIDSNENGEKDSGEEGAANVTLNLGDKSAVSGEGGSFIFPPVYPGEYELDLSNLKAGLEPAIDLPRLIQIEAGEREEVAIPLRPRSWVRGLVFNDKNQNGVRDPGEEGMSDVEFLVSGENVEKVVHSGSNGRFLVDLSPGTFSVKLQKNSLPERFEPTTPDTVGVETEKFGRTEVEFGAYKKPRPIEVTFGPPTASFTYSPEEPKAGDEITLDGTESSAIQTEIDTFIWRLTHDDTTVEKKGKRVTVRLDQPGKWKISLTVTDKNGLKGKAVKDIKVSS